MPDDKSLQEFIEQNSQPGHEWYHQLNEISTATVTGFSQKQRELIKNKVLFNDKTGKIFPESGNKRRKPVDYWPSKKEDDKRPP
ncbi:MAG: hypothetical protein HQL54_09255 [Magnetococcales bacterium]|nr:hypothetical protein [Magnetococcales bacterium]